MGCILFLHPRSCEAIRVIGQVCANDPKCTVVTIKPEHRLWKSDIQQLLQGLRSNRHVKNLTLAGLGLDDVDGLHLALALEQSNIESLDVAGNNFSGVVIKRIVEAIRDRNLLRRLWIGDQRNWDLNPSVMEEIMEMLKLNTSLLVFKVDMPIRKYPIQDEIDDLMLRNTKVYFDQLRG